MSHKIYDKNKKLSKNNEKSIKNDTNNQNFIESKRFFVNDIKDDYVQIDGDEFNHLVNVMRLKVNDNIILICNDDYDYHAKIVEIDKKYAVAKIENKVLNKVNSNINVTAFVAVNKREPMSLMVRMLSELGVNNFIPFTTKWTNPADVTDKMDRYQKIADQSAKQCRRSKTLKIFQIKSLNEICEDFKNFDYVLFANEDEHTKNINDLVIKNLTISDKVNIAFVIGPVAGFDVDEAEKIVQNDAISISLGKRILKADTACITMASLVMNKFER